MFLQTNQLQPLGTHKTETSGTWDNKLTPVVPLLLGSMLQKAAVQPPGVESLDAESTM